METLPQPPEPHVFPCEHCKEPMALWDWGSHPINSPDLPQARCSACLIKAAAEIPKEQDSHWPPLRTWMHVERQQSLNHRMRRSVGEPPGTVIACQVELRDRNDPSLGHLAYLFAVCVDWWDQSWPQLVMPWRLSWQRVAVVLGAHVLASPDIPASWRFLWQWHDPAHQETLIMDPPDRPLTKNQVLKLNRARGAFYTLQDNRGRPPVSGMSSTSTRHRMTQWLCC